MRTYYSLRVFVNACFYNMFEFDDTSHILQCPIKSTVADYIRLQLLGLGLVG